MAKAKLAVARNPEVVTLPLTANYYELVFDDAARITAQNPDRGRHVLYKVKALGATNVKFAIGQDPSASNWGVVAADGWVEVRGESGPEGANNLYAKGSADNAQFAIMVS